MLDALKIGKNVKRDEEKDVVSSGGALDTNVYPAKIKYGYLYKSTRGALMAKIEFDTGGRSVSIDECIMSNKSGELKATYEKGGEVRLLPGYSKILNVFQTVGITNDAGELVQDLSEVEVEERLLKLYDFKERKEVASEQNCLVQLFDENVEIAVYKEVVDKTTNVAGEDEPADYQPTGETREVNEVVKVMNEDGFTLLEQGDEDVTEPLFKAEWIEAHKGKVKNKAKGAKEGAAKSGRPGGKAGGPKKKLSFD